jgi:hypothetical protein
MRDNAEYRQPERELVHKTKEQLQSNNAIYQPGEKPLGNDCVFFDELREIVESRGCRLQHTNISLSRSTDRHGETYQLLV